MGYHRISGIISDVICHSFKMGKYIVCLTLIVITGCYAPANVVQYEPQNIIKERKQSKISPKIIITNPKADQRGIALINSSDRVTIEGMVVSPDLTPKLTIDNENVPVSNDGYFSYERRIFKGKNNIRIVLHDFDNNKIEKVLVIESGKQPMENKHIVPVIAADIERSNKLTLWVLSVGISEYQNTILNLKYADNDAQVLSKTLKSLEGGVFSEVFVKTLVNSQATRGNILTAMTTHLGKAAPDDIVFIFLAGHGIKNNQTGSYYFIPYNADSENLLFEGLKWSDFDEAIKIISTNVNKVILVLDTCHAGAINVAMRNVNVGEDLAATIKNASGLFILSASKAGESSVEDKTYKLPGEHKGHGAFTYSLLKGLNGEAKQTNKTYITVNDLFSYVSAQVPRITNGRQHPYAKMEGTDLPIVLFK